MNFSQGKIRVVLSWVHIILGIILLCYIYSPFSKYFIFQVVVKFVAIPVIVVSGLWIWKPHVFNRFLNKENKK